MTSEDTDIMNTQLIMYSWRATTFSLNNIQWHAGPCVFVIPRFPSYVPSEVLTDGHSIIITTIIKYSNMLSSIASDCSWRVYDSHLSQASPHRMSSNIVIVPSPGVPFTSIWKPFTCKQWHVMYLTRLNVDTYCYRITSNSFECCLNNYVKQWFKDKQQSS